MPEIPEMLKIPEIAEIPEKAEIPEMPEVPENPENPEMYRNTRNARNVQNHQKRPEILEIPEIPEIPEMWEEVKFFCVKFRGNVFFEKKNGVGKIWGTRRALSARRIYFFCLFSHLKFTLLGFLFMWGWNLGV